MIFVDPMRGFILCGHVNIEIRGAGGKALRETILKFRTGWFDFLCSCVCIFHLHFNQACHNEVQFGYVKFHSDN